MRIEGMTDDPDDKDFREGINALVRLAPLLSILTVLDLVRNRDEFRASALSHPRLDPLVTARDAVFGRVTRYLLFETISGLGIVGFSFAFGLGLSFHRALARRIEMADRFSRSPGTRPAVGLPFEPLSLRSLIPPGLKATPGEIRAGVSTPPARTPSLLGRVGYTLGLATA